MSRHGKRRKHRGQEAPEPSRYPPASDGEPGYWATDTPDQEDLPYQPAGSEWYSREEPPDRDAPYSYPEPCTEPYAADSHNPDSHGTDPYSPDPPHNREHYTEPEYTEPEHGADHEQHPPRSRHSRHSRHTSPRQSRQARQSRQSRQARQSRQRHPRPEPLKTNDVKAIAAGTVIWITAFVVLYPRRGQLEQSGHGWVLWSCLAGFGLGLLGLWYVKRRQDTLTKHTAAQGAPAAPDDARDTQNTQDTPEETPGDTAEPDPDHRTPYWSTEPDPVDQYPEYADQAADQHPEPNQYAADSTPDPVTDRYETTVIGEIVFDDSPSPYTQPEPPRRRTESAPPPEDGYGRGWDQRDWYG